MGREENYPIQKITIQEVLGHVEHSRETVRKYRLGEECGLGSRYGGLWNSEETFMTGEQGTWVTHIAGELCHLKRFVEWRG